MSMTSSTLLPGPVRIIDEAGNTVEATQHGELKTLTGSLIMYDQVEGGTLNTNIWTPSTSTMTIVQTNSFVSLNANNSVTANAYANLVSNKVVPFYGEQEVELSTSIMISALPDANEIIEIGFITAATNAAPTDGVFIRITGGVARGVVNFGGAETLSAPMTTLLTGAVQDFDVAVDSFDAEFEIDGVKTIIPVPNNLPFPTSTARQPVCYRVYNTATPPVTGVKLSIGRMEVTQALITVNKPWPELLCEMARSSYQSPVAPFATTCNRTNSSTPSAAALSNTVPSYTTLDGQFKIAAPAAAATDYALFGFQVPTGYQMKVSSVFISTFLEGAAIVTPTTLEWAVGINATAASLATADGAGTVAPRRKCLGAQTFLALAGIGTAAGDLSRQFDPPLVVDSGRWFHIILQIPDGANTASLVYRGTVTVNGFFE